MSRAYAYRENEQGMIDGLTGRLFRDLIIGASEYLGSRKSEVDSLNVFPVPDGDTGTNMFLTISRAASQLASIEDPDVPVSKVAEVCAFECLMGARGNSGVILSQIMRGMSSALKSTTVASAGDLAAALKEAVVTAYKAVIRPVEGTMLTVLREGAAAANECASRSKDVREVLEAFLSAAGAALEKTPEMLPVLKQAGVVDAGGKGLCILFEGALRVLEMAGVPERLATEASSSRPLRAFEITEREVLDIRYPYDTQFLVKGKHLPAEEIRRKLEPCGDSLLVVGSPELLRVHIHTSRPGDVLNLCLEYGTIAQVVIENMVDQSLELLRAGTAAGGSPAGEAAGSVAEPCRKPHSDEEVAGGGADATSRPVPEKETAIVAVASGEGLREIMSSLGADLVIDGGTTMNPSTAELARAVDQLNAKKVIFLPNNSNIFLSAKQAKKLTGRKMYVVPSRTVPQGISALMALNVGSTMSENLKRASKAVRRVKTGEVTFAARNGKFGRHVFREGDVIGLCDGKVEIVGGSPEEVLYRVISRMQSPGYEILTVYCGKDISRETEETLREELARRFSDLEVEVHRGDQPLYYYIVSLE